MSRRTDATSPTSRGRPAASSFVLAATMLLAGCQAGGEATSPQAGPTTTAVEASGAPTTGAADPTTGPPPTSSPGTGGASTGPSDVPRATVDLFDYDASRPLDLREIGTVDHDGHVVRDVTFASPGGGVVPAYLAEPSEDPAGVGIIMVPGMPEMRDAYFQPITEFACAGVTAIVIEPPWAREPARSSHDALTFTDQDHEEQVQLVMDVRRTVDLFEQELGIDRVGYDAISYGAAIGAQVAGVEDRIDAFVLMSVDGGVVDHFTFDGNPIGRLAMVPRDQQEEWIEVMRPIEPILYVGDATTEILFVQGREDNVTPPSKAEAVHRAAGERAEVRWYDAGHDLSPEAFVDHFLWWADQFDLDRDRVLRCIEDGY